MSQLSSTSAPALQHQLQHISIWHISILAYKHISILADRHISRSADQHIRHPLMLKQKHLGSTCWTSVEISSDTRTFTNMNMLSWFYYLGGWAILKMWRFDYYESSHLRFHHLACLFKSPLLSSLPHLRANINSTQWEVCKITITLATV